jgi:hypothetical protein
MGNSWSVELRSALRAPESWASTMSSTVMKINKRGKTHKKAEKHKLATSVPPLSSPNFFSTPKTMAAGPNRCCAASTRRRTFSRRFIV